MKEESISIERFSDEIKNREISQDFVKSLIKERFPAAHTLWQDTQGTWWASPHTPADNEFYNLSEARPIITSKPMKENFQSIMLQ